MQASTGLKESLLVRAGRHAVLIAACLFTALPIVFLYLNTFKTLPEFFDDPYGPPPVLRLANYIQAWDEADIAVKLTNSVMATVGGVLVNSSIGRLSSITIAAPSKVP